MAYMATDANFFAPALPNDGYMDLVCINGDISRLSALQMMFAVETGHFFDIPGVWYRKILGYRIIPKNQEDGYISIDGERVPFAPFQAEVHKGLGTVLSKTGHMYEAPGPL
jgi:sphingosine kinase